MKDNIRNELFRLQDEKYRAFQSKLIPSVERDTVIGIRTPELRNYAKALAKEDGARAFLCDLPHLYFEENQLHAFIISEIRDFDLCMEEICRFLPYIDNWATCDQMSPKVFRKRRAELLEQIEKWIVSEDTYTVRFAVKMLMDHFLDEDFDAAYPELVAELRSDEYYIKMMIAWYFATALAKQYETVLPYIEERRLDVWTHNKAIQKSVESRRISPEQKVHLRSLKVKRKY